MSVRVELFGSKGMPDIGQNLYTVPAGKRLVIDYVSAVSEHFNDANRYNYLLRTTLNGAIQLASFNQLPDGAPSSAVSQKIELFADPGTTVFVDVHPTANNDPDVFLTVSGHLVSL